VATPQFNFMTVSRRCRSAMVERFGRLHCVIQEEETALFCMRAGPGRLISPWFFASQWFVAFLIRCGQFHVKRLDLNSVSLDYGRSMGDDPQDVGAVDALTCLLGLEDDEPGLSLCQWVDLRLRDTILHYYGDTIEGLNWLLALRSKKWEIYLHQPMSTVKSGEVPRVLSYPEIKQIVIHAPCGDDEKSNLGEPEEWIPVLSHLMESCPNLKQLDVVFEPHTEGINFERMAEFRDRVFPHLPQESKAIVRVVYCLYVERRLEGTLLVDHGEAIRRSFVEEMPKDKHIDANDADDEVSLCRATRWDRVGGQQEEGIEPWWVILQINTDED